MIFTHISKCPILNGIEPERLKSIFGNIHYHVKTFDKENIILSAGETCTNLMILVYGQVRGEVLDFAGNTMKIEDISAPRPIAPAFLFGKQNQSPVTIIANIKTQIVFIPKSDVLELFRQELSILENYLDAISSRGQFLLHKVRLLSLKTLKQRVAFFILKNNEVLNIKKFTQRELSEILCVARPSLTRTLIQMENDSILSYNKGYIKILDEQKLKLLLKNCHD